MELVGSTTQFNFFVSSSVMPAEPEAIVKLMPFISSGYVPSFGEEVNENGLRHKILRLEKEINSINYSVTFTQKAISIQIDSARFEASIEIFENVVVILSLLNDVLKVNKPISYRLSVVCNQGYIYEKTIEERVYNKIFAGGAIPFEWSFRHAHKDMLGEESIYHVVAATRGVALVTIKGSVSQHDTIMFSIDNNTSDKNLDFRFSINDHSFLKSLFDKTLSDFNNLARN